MISQASIESLSNILDLESSNFVRYIQEVAELRPSRSGDAEAVALLFPKRDDVDSLGQLAEPIVEAGWEEAQQAVDRLRGQKSAALERIESLAQKLDGLESDPPERSGSSASRW